MHEKTAGRQKTLTERGALGQNVLFFAMHF
jgi:hypothetical protein